MHDTVTGRLKQISAVDDGAKYGEEADEGE
jgi:hypothetical protein